MKRSVHSCGRIVNAAGATPTIAAASIHQRHSTGTPAVCLARSRNAVPSTTALSSMSPSTPAPRYAIACAISLSHSWLIQGTSWVNEYGSVIDRRPLVSASIPNRTCPQRSGSTRAWTQTKQAASNHVRRPAEITRLRPAPALFCPTELTKFRPLPSCAQCSVMHRRDARCMRRAAATLRGTGHAPCLFVCQHVSTVRLLCVAVVRCLAHGADRIGTAGSVSPDRGRCGDAAHRVLREIERGAQTLGAVRRRHAPDRRF